MGDEAKNFVTEGNLEQAGLKILEITPQMTAAVIVVRQQYTKASNEERNKQMKRFLKRGVKVQTESTTIDSNPSTTKQATKLEMKDYRIEYSFNELVGVLGE